MGLKIYNTLTRNKDYFKPIHEGNVGMYVCGPTVYGPPHVGHARSYIVFDLLYRYFLYNGYKVKYVQNITDVGHLVGDADEGDDKIQKKAILEKLDPVAVAYKYENMYFDCMAKLNVLKPTISCRATGHIIEIIDAVKTLKIDYEDFIGYTFSDNPKIWLENIHKIFPDTYTYSKLKKDDKRANLVLDLYKKLVQAYFKLEKAEAAV